MERRPYDLEQNFTYHPADEHQKEFYVELRKRAGELAEYLGRLAPESRELSLARTKLEEVVMWGNASVARNGLREHE